MFTGLVRQLGRIAAVEDKNGVRRFRVESAFDVDSIEMGASIMHSGVCLTVVDFGVRDGGSWHDVEAIPQTLSCTTLGDWEVGRLVNLEPSLCMGDELGGHYVFGHVDCLAQIASVTPEGDSWRIRINVPPEMSKYIAAKGSIGLDGISLTVANVGQEGPHDWFEVAIIPHTWDHTTLHTSAPGTRLNLEVDMLARYVARMLGKDDS